VRRSKKSAPEERWWGNGRDWEASSAGMKEVGWAAKMSDDWRRQLVETCWSRANVTEGELYSFTRIVSEISQISVAAFRGGSFRLRRRGESRLSNHAVDVFLAETTLFVGNSNTLRLATRRGDIVN